MTKCPIQERMVVVNMKKIRKFLVGYYKNQDGQEYCSVIFITKKKVGFMKGLRLANSAGIAELQRTGGNWFKFHGPIRVSDETIIDISGPVGDLWNQVSYI
jgi:hypothetical protein